MHVENFIKRVLEVAADVAQEEAHRLEGAVLRARQLGEEIDTRHYQVEARTARRIERLIRAMKPGDFAALRTLISEGVNDGRV